MTKITNYRFVICAILTVAITLLTSSASSAADYATFSSFYKEGLSISSWVIGGVLAVVGVAAVFFTAGAAAPFTAAIGSAIGGMMGLSGAAATSAGLALLGGGSLAAGGFGMMGGTLLLTAIFEGSVLGGTQVASSLFHNRNYAELCEQVKDYPNFPPIQNGSGPKVIEIVKDELAKKYDMKQLPSAPENLIAVDDALYQIKRWKLPERHFYSIGYDAKTEREKLRVYSLRCILEFMRNNYEEAYKWANWAYAERGSDNGPCTVPLFVRAVSGIFIGKETVDDTIGMFNRVIKDENQDAIVPLLFSIYISRAGAVDKVNLQFLEGLELASTKLKDKKISNIVSSQVMTAILAKLWENQETINFYVQNSDKFDAGKIASHSQSLSEEYSQILRLARRYIWELDRDSKDGKEFYTKANDSLNRYIDAEAKIKKDAEKLQKFASSCTNDNALSDLESNEKIFREGMKILVDGKIDEGLELLRQSCTQGYERACIAISWKKDNLTTCKD